MAPPAAALQEQAAVPESLPESPGIAAPFREQADTAGLPEEETIPDVGEGSGLADQSDSHAADGPGFGLGPAGEPEYEPSADSARLRTDSFDEEDSEPTPAVSLDAPGEPEPESDRVEPVLSTEAAAGDEDQGDIEGPAEAEKDKDAGKNEKVNAAGLTKAQKEKLAAARKKRQPAGIRFWIKVLLIFCVVVGLLAVASKMMDGSETDLVLQPPADVAPVEAKTIPPQQ